MKNGNETPGRVLSALEPGPFKTLEKINPCGALQARKQTNGATSFYWRYSMGAASERVVIGVYDPSAPPKSLSPTARGFSFSAAVRSAEVLALAHLSHDGGRPALLAAERAAAEQMAAAKCAAEAARLNADKYTLRSLLERYCDHLEKLGRRSHTDARGIFQRHVNEAWPNLAGLAANQVTVKHVVTMMRKLMDAGKGRTANKLRSYLRAAYQTAKGSESDAGIPVHFEAFGITINPAANTEAVKGQNRADKHPLSVEQLRQYWKLIKNLPDVKGGALRLHLLTGGQRIEQLVNLKTADIGDGVITLFDSKGRPGSPPRRHPVPLVGAAAKALARCNPTGTFALSTDGGDTHVNAMTLGKWSQEVVNGAIPAFQAKRVRSGVETLLASAGIAPDIRGRLQSHGVSGVQARHYDAHDYLPEKRKALELLARLLEQPETTNVVPIKRARKAGLFVSG
jgi:integrase